MSASAKSLEKRARVVSALGRLTAGSTVTATARSLGVARRTLHRDLANPQTQALVLALHAENEEGLRALFRHSLELCAEAMEATVMIPSGKDKKSGRTKYQQGPDVKLRLAAIGRFADLAQLILRYSPPLDTQQQGGTITWENFVEIYHQKIDSLNSADRAAVRTKR